MPDEEDESLHSVSTEDQLSFWSLTGAFMLKLIAIGITIFILPFNEWIVSDATPGGKIFMVVRHVSPLWLTLCCLREEYLVVTASSQLTNPTTFPVFDGATTPVRVLRGVSGPKSD